MRVLLDRLGSLAAPSAADWARSGAMALTGDPDGPPMAPAAAAPAVMAAAAALLAEHGVRVDGPALLGERAALTGHWRRGTVSSGGATRLLAAADGWLAVALPRPDDWASVPAWLETDAGDWDGIERRLHGMPGRDAIERAALLGLAVTAAGERPPGDAWAATRVADPPPGGDGLVVDLSAMWAGPLCTALLAQAGFEVVKVEDPRRPDGARLGAPAFFALLNRGKRSVVTDLHGSELRRLLERARVVVTGSRRRAIDQLGLPLPGLLHQRPVVWVAITAHGWDGPGSTRVGFGDDAAVAGGLVAWHPGDGQPRFAGDAIADPLCGTLAAVAALSALAAGGSWMIDVSLAGAAAFTAGIASAPALASIDRQGRWAVDGVPVVAPHVGARGA